MHAKVFTTHARARRVALIGAALLTLLAVFAMHGPSNDHVMLMPLDSMAPDEHTHSDGLHLTTASSAGGSEGLSRYMAAMHHGDCVGTLRHDAEPTPPAHAIADGGGHRPVGGATSRLTSTQRGPPAPSLERLCISRT